MLSTFLSLIKEKRRKESKFCTFRAKAFPLISFISLLMWKSFTIGNFFFKSWKIFTSIQMGQFEDLSKGQTFFCQKFQLRMTHRCPCHFAEENDQCWMRRLSSVTFCKWMRSSARWLSIACVSARLGCLTMWPLAERKMEVVAAHKCL